MQGQSRSHQLVRQPSIASRVFWIIRSPTVLNPPSTQLPFQKWKANANRHKYPILNLAKPLIQHYRDKDHHRPLKRKCQFSLALARDQKPRAVKYRTMKRSKPRQFHNLLNNSPKQGKNNKYSPYPSRYSVSRVEQLKIKGTSKFRYWKSYPTTTSQLLKRKLTSDQTERCPKKHDPPELLLLRCRGQLWHLKIRGIPPKVGPQIKVFGCETKANRLILVYTQWVNF